MRRLTDVDQPDPAQRCADQQRVLRYPPAQTVRRRPSTGRASARLYQTFDNCQNDAFATALRTLDARRDRFGDGNAPLREWVGAQAAVSRTVMTARWSSTGRRSRRRWGVSR
jgi:hypothetical protein